MEIIFPHCTFGPIESLLIMIFSTLLTNLQPKILSKNSEKQSLKTPKIFALNFSRNFLIRFKKSNGICWNLVPWKFSTFRFLFTDYLKRKNQLRWIESVITSKIFCVVEEIFNYHDVNVSVDQIRNIAIPWIHIYSNLLEKNIREIYFVFIGAN